MKWFKKLIFLSIGTGIALGAPLVPQDEIYLYSQATYRFNTPNGDLSSNQYALYTDKDNVEDGKYIILSPTLGYGFSRTNDATLIKDKELVDIVCEGCAYYKYFRNSKNEIDRESTDVSTMTSDPDDPIHKKTELVPILGAVKAHAAPAFDAITPTVTGLGTSVSFSHTVSGSNLIVLAGVNLDGANTGTPSCTYNSVSMTQIAAIEGDSSNQEQWTGISKAPSGTQTMACSWTTSIESIVFAISYSEVDQTTPNDTAVTSTGLQASPISDNVTSQVGDLVVDFLTVNGGDFDMAAGAGQTERADSFESSGGNNAGVSEEAGATTVTMSWSGWAGSPRTAHTAFNLNGIVVLDSGNWFNVIQ